MFSLSGRIDAGTALADFQVAPEPRDGVPVTDWERELVNSRSGRGKPRIRGRLDDLPDFRRDYRKIVDLCAGELQNTMFRMSLDFGRLCPRPGEFDRKQMAHYLSVLAHCHLRGIEPILTLHHWPMPIAFCRYEGDAIRGGGWEHPDILEHFAFYLESVTPYLFDPDRIAGALRGSGLTAEAVDRVAASGICRTFITINEPLHHVVTPYILGMFPPFERWAFARGYEVLDRVVEAHKMAAGALREASARVPGGVRVGVAHSVSYVEGNSFVTRPIAVLLDHLANWDIADRFERVDNDFVGIQYYFRKVIGLWGGKLRGRHFGDHPGFGDIYPEGMKRLLLAVRDRYPGRDVYVTEFGFADRTDVRRPYWVLETVRKILEAKAEGVPVEAVLLWTIVDNLEWAEGMEVPFGLYDRHGERLPAAAGRLASREVWAAVASYLDRPTEEGRAALEALHRRAEAQFSEGQTTDNTN